MSDPATELVRSVKTIYSLPATFYRITEVVDDPNSSVDDIAEVISSDQSLSIRLLKLANSSFYGFPSKIDTISHAVTLIGGAQLRDLAQATSVISMFKGVPPDIVSMESFWKHSIGVGITSRLLAARRREPNTERFFVSGLLHDIGRLVIFEKLTDKARIFVELAKSKKIALVAAEREVLGFDHTDVGGALAETWNLPARLQEGIRVHHKFSSVARFALEAAVIHTGDVIAHCLALGTSGENLVPPLNPQAWAQIGLADDDLPILCDEATRQIEEVIQVMLPGASKA